MKLIKVMQNYEDGEVVGEGETPSLGAVWGIPEFLLSTLVSPLKRYDSASFSAYEIMDISHESVHSRFHYEEGISPWNLFLKCNFIRSYLRKSANLYWVCGREVHKEIWYIIEKKKWKPSAEKTKESRTDHCLFTWVHSAIVKNQHLRRILFEVWNLCHIEER